MDEKIFVTYSWDHPQHSDRVVQLTNHLRKNGFNAEMDVFKSQQETAIDFFKMMHHSFVLATKVIVVLSSGYREKADTFTGGVGIEYNLLIKDIEQHPNKYILVSFEPHSREIMPLALFGRELLHLTDEANMQKLFAKLLDEKQLEFSEISPHRPSILKKEIAPFSFETKEPSLKIMGLRAVQESSSIFGSQYNEAVFTCSTDIKNMSAHSVNGISVDISLNRYLATEEFPPGVIVGDLIHIGKPTRDKLYPQYVEEINFKIKLTHYNIKRVIDSSIEVTVFSEEKPVFRSFLLRDLLFLGQGGTAPQRLSIELFNIR